MKLAKITTKDISKQLEFEPLSGCIISNQLIHLPMLAPGGSFVLDGAAFAICVSGKAEIKINFKRYVLEKDTLISILPYFVTTFLNKSKDFEMYYLFFSTDFMNDMPNLFRMNISNLIIRSACMKLTEKESENTLTLYQFLIQKYQSIYHPFRAEAVKGILYGLLAELGVIYTRFLNKFENNEFKLNTHQGELTYTFFRLLTLYHKKEHKLQFYADKMYLTSKYLSSIIKEGTGRTGTAWINDAIISSAKYLLNTTSMTIVQISEELNFPNPSFFGRYFKNHTGMTPVKYRKSF